MLSKFDGGKGTQNTPPFDKALKGPSFPGLENAVTKRGERGWNGAINQGLIKWACHEVLSYESGTKSKRSFCHTELVFHWWNE